MASLSIRGLDERVKERLRLRAARNGRSVEAEVRLILEAAVAGEVQGGLGIRMRARVAPLGGVELELPHRAGRPRAAKFG
jgi:plasmid stability protein